MALSMQLLSLLLCTALFCGVRTVSAQEKQAPLMKIVLASPVFQEGDMIPKKYACDGNNVTPPLNWGGTPRGTKSFALIMEDPDRPGGTFTHWVIYNIPADSKELLENIPIDQELPNGAIQGVNDTRSNGYVGPCPPTGTHRYFFTLYALDTVLPRDPAATSKSLRDAMKGHVLAEGQLMGKYYQHNK